ncbi:MULTISPECIES: 8-oxo-dGTP diphosphatase [Bacillaceae]|uniref:8-oxo-dGTP diphosphatase n=1 Tax=Bacillaceae TaxID=186817 RepID=UPI001E4E52D6|nr:MULTISPECIES: 8-oxo-dGTP diphosphatase [Bacillaceae]MCE4051401.1 8-oxo-dGTP diphosphatase [Bacillus sp. Au-Bac7]UPO89987.1 8-oxo-dGTP diphosphatase [Niallia sp. Man26]
MGQLVNVKIWTVCMIQKDEKVLLLNRQHDHFKGFIPPGGKVDFPESIVQSAIREVKEETGLEVSNLIYKGLYEYVNPVVNDRYMIFNYITRDFKGELLEDGPEGKANWVNIEEAYNLPMQPSIKRRFPLFFKDGTFEIHVVWNHKEKNEGTVTIHST